MIKYISSPARQPKTEGLDLFLEVLRCSQIGLPLDSIYIYAIHRITVNQVLFFIAPLSI